MIVSDAAVSDSQVSATIPDAGHSPDTASHCADSDGSGGVRRRT